MKKVKEFIIDRSRMARGNILPDTQGCCCSLGQYLQACDAKVVLGDGWRTAESLAFGEVREALSLDGKISYGEIDTSDVWEPNDVPPMPDEPAIVEAFARWGVMARFEGEYTDAFKAARA